jgi:predicted XRE-type DNA-binding protein
MHQEIKHLTGNPMDTLKAPKPTGRRYNSVADLIKEEIPPEIQKEVNKLQTESRLTLLLAKIRQKAQLTQEQIAGCLETTQSNISKLEHGCDDELTIKQIKEYIKATGERINVSFGKPLTHVEAIKYHALSIKEHFEELATIANQHEDLERDIQAFFGEAFFNLLNIMAKCNEQLPNANKDSEIRIHIMKEPPSVPQKPISEALVK